MRILISGASGLVGSTLIPVLIEKGHKIGRLVRRKADRRAGEIFWDPVQGSVDKEGIQDFAPEAVVHLAGENIARKRWNARQKALIRDSRVEGSKILAMALASLENPPSVVVSASALGFYGDRGDQLLIESSGPGEGFLPDVCQAWEGAFNGARAAGIRVVNLRIGVVMSKAGGALKKMLTPFRLGVGGVLGNGRQYFSWIDLEDLVGAIIFSLENQQISGPVNAVSPNPVTNREFTKTLGKVLFRPTLFPMPASTVRMVFGEMADDLLLASTRVKPGVLEKAGFHFKYPELKESLRHQIKG